MKEVTKDEFYRAISPLNVHPRALEDRSDWELQDGSRRLVGRTEPGYRSPYGTAKRYFLMESLT